MAHILFVYKQLPAPSVGHAGGESLFRLMDALHQRGHTLSLVARVRDEEKSDLPHVQAICEHCSVVPHHKSMTGPRAWTLARSYLALRRAASKAIREWSPDLVHLETLQTAAALWGVRRPPASFRPQDVNWYLMAQSAANRGASSPITKAKIALVRELEMWLICQHDLILAISEGDRRLLAPYCAHQRILLLPLFPAVTPRSEIEPAVAPHTPNLLFVGAMYRDHNLTGVDWFLNHVWPRVLAEIPTARFYIVGSNPPPTLYERQREENFVVTGFVDDLAPWYQAATLFVSPLLVGGGLLQKVIDAMAMRVPVVATSGSNHGLGATPGKHVLSADTPAEFADAVLGLLRDPATRERLAQAAQDFIYAHYDAEEALDRWEAALCQLQERQQD